MTDRDDAEAATEEAARAGADIELPAEEDAERVHTTRTIEDAAAGDEASAPLTTDPEAQDEDSIVNPASS